MNWFKKKIINWMKRDWYNDELVEGIPAQTPVYNSSGKLSASRSIETPVRFNFTVIPASGGRVVEFNTYDHQKDRSVNTVHVIPDDADFSHELTKIVSIELLKN